MKTIAKNLFPMLAAAILALGSGCGASDDWKQIPYDVPAGASLGQVLRDISDLSGISFAIDSELQAQLDVHPAELPVLLGLNIGQVLTLLQDTMPPETAYLYEERSGPGFFLIPRFQQAEDPVASTPKIVDFDEFAKLGFRALISDPLFEEECGEPDDILAALGAGGIFEVSIEVLDDPGGHAPFIGDYPPLVELSIDGNDLAIHGDAPWVPLTGLIQNNGSFTCSGSGTVAGFPNVSVEFVGQATPGSLSGTLTVGAGGELPGGHATVYKVQP